jgi:hypothetical protein
LYLFFRSYISYHILYRKQFLLLTALVFISGCHSFGPDGLRGSYSLYNTAIVDSQNEQFIQNIVRLHYRDPVFFLDVTNVTASLRMDLAASMDGTTLGLTQPSTGLNILTLNAGGAYASLPTISYSPLQGEGFVKSMLSHIDLHDIFTLIGSGWSSSRVLGLCVERINGLDNASTGSGPTPKLSPKRIGPFQRLLKLFEIVIRENLIAPRIDPTTKEMQLEIKSNSEFHDVIWEIKQLLELDQKLEVYHLSSDFLRRSDTISIHSRSLMSIFFYLSHHVDTPDTHKKSGLVTVTLNEDGSKFDWIKTTVGSLFHILYSEKQPDLAFVSIPYRGQWFYLADNDLESKSTFMLLTQLFRLQAGAAKSSGPALTLPVR